jgi:hypothetical protein
LRIEFEEATALLFLVGDIEGGDEAAIPREALQSASTDPEPAPMPSVPLEASTS